MKSSRLYPAAGLALLLSVLQFAAVATANAQSREENRIALHKAGVIAKIISGDAEMPERDVADELLEGEPQQEYAYVVTYGNVDIVGGAPVYYGNVAIVRPGTHLFRVRYSRTYQITSEPQMRAGMMVTTVMTYTEYSAIIPVAIDLEPGRYYTFQEKIERSSVLGIMDQISISSREVTDRKEIERAQEKAQDIIANPGDYLAYIVTARDYSDYMEWWQAHRGLLEGSYVSEDGRTEFRFEGDRFSARNTRSMQGRTGFAYGTYLFNDRTIILQTDSIKTTTLAAIRNRPGKETVTVEKISEAAHYQLNGDTLELSGSVLHRRPEDNASPQPPESGGSGNVTASGMASLDIAWRVEEGALIVSGRGEIPGDPAWSSAIDEFTSAVIGDGITGIGHHAFAMSGITSIVIGRDVTHLDTYALFRCSNLAEVEVRSAVPPRVGSFAFMMTPVGKAKLIVPAGTKAAYEREREWKKFGTIEERGDL